MNRVEIGPLPSTPAEQTLQFFELEVGPRGPWSENPEEFDPLYVLSMMGVHVIDYLAIAINHLAAAGMLVRSGEYLYSVVPVIRASAEASASVVWLLDRTCRPRQFAARVMLDRLTSFQRQIDDTSRAGDVGARDAIKECQKSLRYFFDKSEITKSSGGWDGKAALAGESVPGLEQKWALLGRHYGQAKDYERLYGRLSLLTHPNITHLEMLKSHGSYFVHPEELRGHLWIGFRLYREAMQHAVTFFGWGRDHEPLIELDNRLIAVFPDAFSTQGDAE